MEKEVIVGDKTYLVKEIKYKDVTKLSDSSKEDSAKKLMQSSTGITDEEYEELTMKDGMAIQKVINDINGLDSFQKPLKE